MKILKSVIVLFFISMSLMALPGVNKEAIVLKALNKQLKSQVNPIVFPAFQTRVSAKIMRDQIDKYFPAIKAVVNAVNTKLPDYVVEVAGYANPPGDKSSQKARNTAMRLATARAKSVRAVFIKKGLKAAVLVAKGMGDADRITSSFDDNMDDWGKNRRVILRIVKK